MRGCASNTARMQDTRRAARILGPVEPIRIDRVITRLNIGGPSQHAIILTGALNDERFSSRLICGRVGPGEGDMTPEALARRLPVTQLPVLRNHGGMIVARYRDVRQVMMNLLQILLFVTPVFWSPDQVGRRFGQWFVTPNLLFHYVDILRSPLLGRAPAVLTWEMVLLSTIAGWAITFWTYSRFRRRLAYWL